MLKQCCRYPCFKIVRNALMVRIKGLGFKDEMKYKTREGEVMKHVIKGLVFFILLCPFFNLCSAKTYKWQSVEIVYDKPWEVLTDKTINNMRMVHLDYKSSDNYPLSLMLSIIPKKSQDKKEHKDFLKVSANVAAVNFALPFLKRYAKLDNPDSMLVTFNGVNVGSSLASGALILVPTPKKKIYISAQSFFIASDKYYVLGMLITRVDKGIVRTSKEYARRVRSAYLLLQNMKLAE